jgi:acetyl esterase/lipase
LPDRQNEEPKKLQDLNSKRYIMQSFDPAKYGTIDPDVPYCQIDGLELKMDVYFPSSGGPWPCMLFVHGGGWTEGDKAPMPVVPTEAGLLVVSINYRMYPAYRFPAMIEDVKCAIRFLRHHSAEFNLNPEKIALVGHSAGAHLSALAGLTEPSAGWDTGPYLDQSSRVQAVVAMSGPFDLAKKFPEWVEDLKINVFGEDRYVSSSPITYVRQDSPPFLIIHGDCDDAVPVEQANILHAALTEAGASSQLLIMANAGHGLDSAGGPVSPPIEMVYMMILGFLANSLNG